MSLLSVEKHSQGWCVMMKWNRGFLLFLTLLAAGILLVSCSDDDNPANPGGGGGTDEDNTPPQVVNFSPSQGAIDVSLDREVRIFFSEPIDTVGTAGKVTLSQGTITSLDWDDTRTMLSVDHTDWAEYSQVAVTVATTFQDDAGNALASEAVLNFLTYTSDFLFLGSNPADGEQDVLRNTVIQLQFNKAVIAQSISDNVIISTPDKATHSFTVGDQLDNGWRNLVLDDSLPSDTEVTVTVGADVRSYSDVTLGTESSFSFTTGTEIDSTPPVILSFDPASGSEISAWDNVWTITFDKPIDQEEGLDLLGADLLTMIGIEVGGNASWNPDGTVFTISVGSPLPTGVELTLEFGDFQDLYGNVNTTHPVWTVNVAGTPDHMPVQEEIFSGFTVIAHESTPDKVVDTFMRWRFMEWETPGSDFRWYTRDEYEKGWSDWDYMTKTSDAVMLRGFHEVDEGEPVDILFSDPAKYLNHPLVPASWSGEMTIGSGEEMASVSYSVTVLDGVEDVPWDMSSGKVFADSRLIKGSSQEFYWPNCRRVVLTHETSAGGNMMDSGADTSWYCPGFGLVKFTMYSHEYGEDESEDWENGILSDLLIKEAN